MTADNGHRWAAVAYLERPDDGKILCVWNKRYEGWSLPGGMVEDGETHEEAMKRELREETGVEAIEHEVVFSGPHGLESGESRATHARIFRVTRWSGEAAESEPGCPVSWLRHGKFLKASPFAPFYHRVFDQMGKLNAEAHSPLRRKLEKIRYGISHDFEISSQSGGLFIGHITANVYEDGSLGELFLTISKEGSTMSGLIRSLSKMTSIAIQYGAPVRVLVDLFKDTRFEPSGRTNNPEIPQVSSVLDYVFRFIERRFLSTQGEAK